jgi:hypothetical protein
MNCACRPLRDDDAVLQADVFGDRDARLTETDVDGLRPGNQRPSFANVRADRGIEGELFPCVLAVPERIPVALGRAPAILGPQKIRAIS